MNTTNYTFTFRLVSTDFDVDRPGDFLSITNTFTFTIVDTVFTNNASHGSKPWHRVVAGEYYYKISAFKEYPDGRLEGRACQPVWVKVPI